MLTPQALLVLHCGLNILIIKKQLWQRLTSIFDVTLSPNFKVGNLTIIPELRLDAGKDEIFEKSDGTGTKTTVTGILAATYHF